MTQMTITELRRVGSGTEPTLVAFAWTSATHSSMLGALEQTLAVKTVRVVPAGSEEPVEQVISASWEPFEVVGEWSDRWAGAGFARNMKREFSRLVGRTPLVRFQLDEESIVGLITSLKIRYETFDRIGYSFMLSPHKNESVGSFRQAANVVQPQPINQRVEEAADQLDKLVAIADVADTIPVRTEDIIDAETSIAELTDASERARAAALEGLGQDAERKLLSLASTFRRVRGAAQSVALSVARKRSDLAIAFTDVIEMLKFEEWVHETGVEAARTVGKARLAELDMRAKAARKPRAIHRARKGESLERISMRYYGTADNWRAIYDVNHLDSVLLDGGEELLIPERAS